MRQTEDSYTNSHIYLEFKEIEQNEFRNIVRFFESHTSEIAQLEFNEYFELLLTYAEALFEIGTYHSYLSVADQAIAITIEHNIKYYHGEDIFFNLLFKKAAAHYNLLEYDKSEHILRELVKMNPDNEMTVRFLKKSIRQNKPSFIKSTRAISVFLFLLTAGIIAVELCLVRPFFAEYIPIIELVRNIVFGAGWTVLIVGDLFYRWLVNNKVNKFIGAIKQRKQKQKVKKEEVFS